MAHCVQSAVLDRALLAKQQPRAFLLPITSLAPFQISSAAKTLLPRLFPLPRSLMHHQNPFVFTDRIFLPPPSPMPPAPHRPPLHGDNLPPVHGVVRAHGGHRGSEGVQAERHVQGAESSELPFSGAGGPVPPNPLCCSDLRRCGTNSASPMVEASTCCPLPSIRSRLKKTNLTDLGVRSDT